MNYLVIFSAQYLYLIIAFIGAIVFFILRKKKEFLSLMVPSFTLSYLLAKILGSIIKSPRPFFTDHIQPLIPTSTDNGFPSDHTLLAMSIALVVYAYNKKVGIVLIILSLCVGIARILTHSHHPIDIVASIGIALFSLVCVMLLRALPAKKRTEVRSRY